MADRIKFMFSPDCNSILEREDSAAAEEEEEAEAEEELADKISTISGASTVSGSRSNVWKHFRIIDNKALCVYCQ